MGNIDVQTVSGFGDEWSRFDQSVLTQAEHSALFEAYFGVFPWELLPAGATGFDLGCGSGRWAKGVAPRVGKLHLVDASLDALQVAKRNLGGAANCEFHHASVDQIPLADGSMDFGYSLGVLHHVPDTLGGLKACTRRLKPGAPFLLYLYYRFDNRPAWFRLIWKLSDLVRKGVSSMPHSLRYVASQILAGLVYWPLARTAWVLEKLGVGVDSFPLSGYRHRSFYTMRTDALDRFGTRLEQRFTRAEMKTMMEEAGLEGVRFSEAMPYWCAVGIKKA